MAGDISQVAPVSRKCVPAAGIGSQATDKMSALTDYETWLLSTYNIELGIPVVDGGNRQYDQTSSSANAVVKTTLSHTIK